MEEIGYGQEYKYAHDYPNHFIEQQYLPDAIRDKQFWVAQGSANEQRMAEWMQRLWKDRKKD